MAESARASISAPASSRRFRVRLDRPWAFILPAVLYLVVFSIYPLVSSLYLSFNEFNLIICRNVMIYFDRALQDRVHRLFFESLVTFGVLGLGHRESIRFSPHEKGYEELDATEKLYRKID